MSIRCCSISLAQCPTHCKFSKTIGLGKLSFVLLDEQDFLVAVRHFHLASCHQLHSDNNHAVCVFTGEKTWDQLSFLLSGMVSRSLSVTSECVGSVLVSFLLFLLEPAAEYSTGGANLGDDEIAVWRCFAPCSFCRYQNFDHGHCQEFLATKKPLVIRNCVCLHKRRRPK